MVSNRQSCDLHPSLSDPPSPSSLSGPKSSHRASWILKERSWSGSLKASSLPRRMTVQRQEPTDSSGWGLAPSLSQAHAAVGVAAQPGSDSSHLAMPGTVQRAHWLWGLAGPGFKLQFSNHVAYDCEMMVLFSESQLSASGK